jgi:hypothetical protein
MHWNLLTTDFDEIEAYLNDGRRITNVMRDAWLIQLMENHKKRMEEGIEVQITSRSTLFKKIKSNLKSAS